jgi:hypothetical protein
MVSLAHGPLSKANCPAFVSGDGPLANSAQRRVVGTSRQIEMNENITLVISDPFSLVISDPFSLVISDPFWGRMRVSGSRHIFTQTGIMERINLQREGSKAKPYQVRQVRKIMANYKLL